MNSVRGATLSFVDDAVDALDRDQVVTCARLLAVSLAHQRAKFGVIPIASSSTEAARAPATSVGVSLKQAAADTVNEALAVLQDVSAQETAATVGNTADVPVDGPDKRR